MSDQDELNYEAMLDESMDQQLADMKTAIQGKSGKEIISDLERQLAEAQERIATATSMINEGLENAMSLEQVLIDVEKMLEGGGA